jgi:hypothetical protein
VAKELQKVRNKKAMQGKPVKTTIPGGTTIQQKGNPTNVNTNTVTYASVAASGLHYQQPIKLEYSDINRTLQLILTKITNLEVRFQK